MDSQWKPDFKKWYEVDVASYKFIFEQAQKRFEDVLSNSEAITENSKKVIIAVATMFSFFIGFLVNKKVPFGQNYLPIVIFIVNIACCLYLLFPKKVRSRGFAPTALIPKDLDHPDDKEFQEQMLYYNAIAMLQESIDFMREKNDFRAKVYLASLVLGMTLITVGAGMVISHL